MVIPVVGVLEITGKTPLIEVEGVTAKLETTNPTGSIKDRMVLYMVKKAEERGELKQGDEIIEVTSGNTGISLAMVSAVKGYKFTAVMSGGMSVERRRMIEAFGAKTLLTPAEDGIWGAIKKYNELIKEKNNAWLPKQFENPDNFKAHEEGLGKEILEEIDGKIDAFVAGIGTGGTLIGVARALRKADPKVKIIGVEPAESAVLSGERQGPHKIQGIGEGFIPKIVKDNINLIDEIITVKSEDAIAMREELAKKHGILVGISSGANFLASKKIKEKYDKVVTIFPDRGERYLSMD